MRWSSASRWSRALLIISASLACAVCLAGCGSEPDPSPSASSPAPTQSTTPLGDSATVPVYYLIDTPNGLRLAREFQRTEEAAGAAVAAVSRMLSQPAADPDYSSPWNAAARVRSVDVSDDVIRVDLTQDVREASVGAAAADLAVQQLVYTVTAALQQDLPVALLIEGEPAGELWGHVVWDQPVSRAPALDVRLLVQINDPGEGVSVPASFTVTGEAATFEANLPWKILDGSGAVVQQGSGMTAEGQTLAPFEFRIDFTGAPGSYVLQIEEDDPSDGEGGPVMIDDKSITIG